WMFVKWTGGVSSTNSTVKITMDKAKTVTAVFRKSYKLTVHVTGDGSVTKSPGQSGYAPNTKVTLTANPATGWEFVKWQGDATGTQNPVEVTMDQAKTVTAVFKKKTFEIIVHNTGNGNQSID